MEGVPKSGEAGGVVTTQRVIVLELLVSEVNHSQTPVTSKVDGK